MRATRLLKILMTLQARRRVSASALAEECEVSVRTIYRDVDALSSAGVPIYADRGSEGGYRLLEGYRTRLNGVSEREAEAMFLSGLPGAADALGLGATLVTAQLKLSTALPESMRSSADRTRTRFDLDAPGWLDRGETPEHLRTVFEAVWHDRLIDIRYRSWKSERRRQVAPLGLVLKAGAWYLIGSVGASVRTYRISRICDLALLDEHFERPAAFDLADYWRESTARLEEELHSASAVVRLTPAGIKMLPAFLSPYAQLEMVLGDEDDAGFRVATLPVGSVSHACSELLRFGTDVEVIGPPALREHMIKVIDQLGRTYLRP